MPPVRFSALAFFALTVGLWMDLGDGSAWRTAAVVLGAALISWALMRSGTAHGAVECAGVERPAAAPRVTGRQRIGTRRRGQHDRAARMSRDIRCGASAGRRGPVLSRPARPGPPRR